MGHRLLLLGLLPLPLLLLGAIGDPDDQRTWILLGVLALVIYFTPWLIALIRGHPNSLAIGVLNLLLGWTLLGWAGAMVWAVLRTPVAPSAGAVRVGARRKRMP